MRVAEVSASAIESNVKRILEMTGGKHLIAVVKANGYGHGAVKVANIALKSGASIIGVTDLGEAFQLREGGFEGPILSWLHGPGANFEEALEKNIFLGLTRLDQLESLAAAVQKTGRKATVHLKLDTGLSRGGFAPETFTEAFAKAHELEQGGKLTVAGIFSHLSNAGAEEDLKQQAFFEAALEKAYSAGLQPKHIHLASSAATFTSPHLFYNTVRVGLALYGLSPLDDVSAHELGLRPAMTLKAQVIATRGIGQGIGVSYNYVFRSEHDTNLALIPLGYADGLPRVANIADSLKVSINGKECEVVGRIAMDQCVIDLTPLGEEAKNVKVGDYVTLFGDGDAGLPTLDRWAELTGTINYEIAARLGNRIVRETVA